MWHKAAKNFKTTLNVQTGPGPKCVTELKAGGPRISELNMELLTDGKVRLAPTTVHLSLFSAPDTAASKSLSELIDKTNMAIVRNKMGNVKDCTPKGQIQTL